MNCMSPEKIAGNQPIFSASEYAAALSPFYSRNGIYRVLNNISPDGRKVVKGQETGAWTIESIPHELRMELFRRTREHKAGSVFDWLNNPSMPWQPKIPFSSVSQKTINDAVKLQSALRAALSLPNETSIAERARIARESFAKVCGYHVSERHLRRIITRTMERDAGLNAWHRLEIYLSDTEKHKLAPVTPSIPSPPFPELEDAFSTIEDRTCATATEAAYCWRVIAECILDRVASGESAKKLKAQIARYVVKVAPFLAENIGAFRRNLNRKLATAASAEGIAAITDQRQIASGHQRRAPEWDENIKLLAQWTRTRGGRESQAWRELHTGKASQGQRFSEAFREYYPFEPRSAKSQVPSVVRAAISPIMAATNAIHLGPKAAKIALPSIHRDWSDTAAGDFLTADDVTLNHYWFEEHEFGEYEFDGMRFNVVRGQWLLVCDERTDNPLSFLLMPNRNYNSRVIRTLNAKTFSDERIGLPFKGMKYEQGIWKARNIAAQFSWSLIDEAFTRQGIALRVRHSTGPKAKIIERVIGSAQNMMEHLPGYIGRDEMHVRYERVQNFLKALKRAGQPIKAQLDPREMLLNKEQLADELVKVMRDFAAEPQNGERLAGLSPAEAWTQLSPGKPHAVLPESLSYLLSTHKSTQTVTSEGIKLKIGELHNYYVGNPRLGELRGEKVEVFYNEELPGQVVVIHPASDPKKLNPFSVPLFERVPANTASAEDFAAAKAHQKKFSSFGREIYRIIAPPTNLTMRNDNLGTPEMRERGGKINALEREHIGLGNSRKRHARTIDKLARRSNLKIDPAKVRNPQRVIESLTRAQKLEKEIEEMESVEQSPAPITAKTYTLNIAPAKTMSITQRFAMFNKLWKALEVAKPGINRFAIMRRATGKTSIKEMTHEEFGKLTEVLTAIGRDANL
jgi:hypothetical protein